MLAGKGVGINASGRWLIQDIDIDVSPGELLVVVGPNGAGKTTLLGALAGDRSVDQGLVSLADENINDLSLGNLAGQRAVVSQPVSLAFDYTVEDVVSMGWRQTERYGEQARANALEDVLKECELVTLMDQVYMTLSSGEKQRVSYARGLLQVWRPQGDNTDARWMLLDEPTANLDIAYSVEMLESLKRYAASGLGVMAILHDLNLAARFADRVLLLDSGKTVAIGTAEEVMTSDRLSEVYRTQVLVEHNTKLNRLVVLT